MPSLCTTQRLNPPVETQIITLHKRTQYTSLACLVNGLGKGSQNVEWWMKGVEAHDKLPTRRCGEGESAVGLRGEQKEEKHKKGY